MTKEIAATIKANYVIILLTSLFLFGCKNTGAIDPYDRLIVDGYGFRGTLVSGYKFTVEGEDVYFNPTRKDFGFDILKEVRSEHSNPNSVYLYPIDNYTTIRCIDYPWTNNYSHSQPQLKLINNKFCNSQFTKYSGLTNAYPSTSYYKPRLNEKSNAVWDKNKIKQVVIKNNLVNLVEEIERLNIEKVPYRDEEKCSWRPHCNVKQR